MLHVKQTDSRNLLKWQGRLNTSVVPILWGLVRNLSWIIIIFIQLLHIFIVAGYQSSCETGMVRTSPFTVGRYWCMDTHLLWSPMVLAFSHDQTSESGICCRQPTVVCWYCQCNQYLHKHRVIFLFAITILPGLWLLPWTLKKRSDFAPG